MFDSQSQPTRTGGAQHQPVCSLREGLIRQSRTEEFIINPMVFHDHAALGNSRRAAGFKHVDRFILQWLWHPATHRATAKPFVFEERKLLQIVEAIDVLERIEVKSFLLLQPEFASGVITEMPLNHLASMLIQQLSLLLTICIK